MEWKHGVGQVWDGQGSFILPDPSKSFQILPNHPVVYPKNLQWSGSTAWDRYGEGRAASSFQILLKPSILPSFQINPVIFPKNLQWSENIVWERCGQGRAASSFQILQSFQFTPWFIPKIWKHSVGQIWGGQGSFILPNPSKSFHPSKSPCGLSQKSGNIVWDRYGEGRAASSFQILPNPSKSFHPSKSPCGLSQKSAMEWKHSVGQVWGGQGSFILPNPSKSFQILPSFQITLWFIPKICNGVETQRGTGVGWAGQLHPSKSFQILPNPSILPNHPVVYPKNLQWSGNTAWDRYGEGRAASSFQILPNPSILPNKPYDFTQKSAMERKHSVGEVWRRQGSFILPNPSKSFKILPNHPVVYPKNLQWSGNTTWDRCGMGRAASSFQILPSFQITPWFIPKIWKHSVGQVWGGQGSFILPNPLWCCFCCCLLVLFLLITGCCPL
ncbi:transmembrane protein 88B isoform X3 [Vidua chalybeata]|uniref:transmembrane protein 88B isoform X3 n=1 Tax=Vidua chalybeata TaxID=81927 RepID=UPI0023A800FB|nr:transmembrane protein 88B isoform X3 [Vidua chalybeata]